MAPVRIASTAEVTVAYAVITTTDVPGRTVLTSSSSSMLWSEVRFQIQQQNINAVALQMQPRRLDRADRVWMKALRTRNLADGGAYRSVLIQNENLQLPLLFGCRHIQLSTVVLPPIISAILHRFQLLK